MRRGGGELILSGQVVCSWAGNLKVEKEKNQQKKKRNPKDKVSTKKVNKRRRTFNHKMRNPAPSSGQNSQLVRWWVLVHAGAEFRP